MAGDWSFEVYEEAITRAFRTLGHEVHRFSWCEYYNPADLRSASALKRFGLKFQNKFLTGPMISRINADFLDRVRSVAPELVFINRGTHITAQTLRRVRKELPGIAIAGYNNDDPYSKAHPFWLWRHFLSAVPEHDLVLAYRHHNIEELLRGGARRAELLRSWFIPELNRPVQLTSAECESFSCDVVFVGHYEPDGRLELLEEVVRRGYRLRLFGSKGWDRALGKSKLLRHLTPVAPARDANYGKALAGAKIALCFLSKLNRDTYTRRCFEIPATGVCMLSEFTNDLATLFREDEEVLFFRDKGEFIQKLERYLKDDVARRRIASGGYRRVREDGHDVVSRMAYVLDLLSMKNK